MDKLTYGEQLKHPNWQRRRLEMLNAADWECVSCGERGRTLHVHHKHYVKGRMAWEYGEDELTVLCETCHQGEHANKELLDQIIALSDMGTGAIPLALGLLGGYLDADCCLDPEQVDAIKRIDGHSYDLGVLASIASGCGWPAMAKAARILAGRSLSPAQIDAIARWESVDA